MRRETDLKLDRDSLLRILVGARLFRGVDSEVVRTLVPHASVHRLTRGEQLWRHETAAEHLHVIVRGVLELQRITPSNESTLVALFGPGESPGMPVALEERPYIADALAATSTVDVLRVRARPVLELLATNATLAQGVTRALLDHCRLIHAKLDVLSSGTVPKRLAACLLDLNERFGDEQEDGSDSIPFVLSRHQLATYVCARVETVIRTMSSWQRDGLVITKKDGFVIPSPDALRTLLTERRTDDVRHVRISIGA